MELNKNLTRLEIFLVPSRPLVAAEDGLLFHVSNVKRFVLVVRKIVNVVFLYSD